MALVSRASSDGQARWCAGSIYLMNHAVPRHNHDDDHPASVGTRVHALLAQAIGKGERVEFAEKGDEEVKFLFFACMEVWKEVRGIFDGEVSVEMALGEGTDLPGHCDLVIWDGVRLAVLDWKTGRTVAGREQLIGYLGRVLEKFPKWKPRECYYVVVTPRERDRDIQQVSVEEVEEHMRALRDNLAKARELEAANGQGLLKHYTTGSHCDWCGARAACPAMGIALRSFVMAVMGKTMPSVDDMTDAEIGMARLAVKTLDQWKRTEWEPAIKQRVDKRGPIRLGGGKVLMKTELTRKEIVKPEAAARVVEMLGGKAPAVEMGNAAFDEAVADLAREKGQTIKSLKEEAWEMLMKSGAARTRVEQRYEEKRDDGRPD